MPDLQITADAEDRESDRRLLLVMAGTLLTMFAVGAAVQTVFALRIETAERLGPLAITLGAGLRIAVNLFSVGLALVLAAAAKLNERSIGARVRWLVVIASVSASVRFAVQLATGIYDNPSWEVMLTEVLSAFGVVIIALGLGLVQTDARVRLRVEERLSASQAVRAAEALEALASEELRVRREVAESLHGTVQNRLLMAGMRLEGIISSEASSLTDVADDLVSLRSDLADIREREVRQMSHLLYPAGVSVGVAHAVRLLVDRLPSTIAASVDISPDFALGDALSADRRVLLVRAAEEAITNALKHGSAGALSVRLRALAGGGVELSVGDDGVGLDASASDARPGSRPGSGLARLAERAEVLGGTLSVGAREEGGTVLRLTLPE